MIFRYQIFNPEGKLACTGETVQVFIDTEGNLQLNNPLFFEQWKQKMGLL
jgi:acyl-CoA thioester hydrolase